MKAVVAAFNQEKALVGAFSVIVQPVVEPMDRFTALPRNEFIAQPQYDQFGFGFARSADEVVEGFGDDDLFYDVNNTEDIVNNQRAGDDYDSESGKHSTQSNLNLIST